MTLVLAGALALIVALALGWNSPRPIRTPDWHFNGYGLVYRAQDVANHYVFAVGSDGYYAVLQVTGDEETVLVDWQQFPHVRRGQQANRLCVACAGLTCQLYINDEYATTVRNDTRLAGDVGLWVQSLGDRDTVVQFTSARVWKQNDR